LLLSEANYRGVRNGKCSLSALSVRLIRFGLDDLAMIRNMVKKANQPKEQINS